MNSLKPYLILMAVLILAGVSFGWWVIKDKNSDMDLEGKIRLPAVAGEFYPSDQEELSSLIDKFLNKAKTDADKEGLAKIIIVPHAGYFYSGSVAAYAFKILENQDIKRVILIGPSHHQFLTKAVIDGDDFWQTPLGKVSLDKNLAKRLIGQSDLFTFDSLSHQAEHSLEVELPFLQKVLNNDFKILPILVNFEEREKIQEVAKIIAQYIDSSTLLVASSDFSHYPSYNKAEYADQKVIKAILSGELDELIKTIGDLKREKITNLFTCLCGQSAVEIALEIGKILGVDKIKLLKYANSGDAVSNPESERVVGYAAIAFFKKNSFLNPSFSPRQKSTLLAVAKSSVEKYVLDKKIPKFKINDPLLNKQYGVFVTLKKGGELRGCLGVFEPELPLYQAVSQMAIAAAEKDPRFPPLRPEELGDLSYEISVLSPLKKISDWRKIEVGQDGVEVRQGLKRGVFLPQVAKENNWGLEEFLSNLCRLKAGLPADCYKDPNTEIYVFRAEVFGD